jgi:hypothetical protein
MPPVSAAGVTRSGSSRPRWYSRESASITRSTWASCAGGSSCAAPAVTPRSCRDHVTVTQSTCYLCHFKDRPAGEPIAGCTGCHSSPPRVTSPSGFVVDHPKYVEELTSCISCHEDVTVGSGAAERDRCFTCHNQPERLRRFDDVTLMHRVHIMTQRRMRPMSSGRSPGGDPQHHLRSRLSRLSRREPRGGAAHVRRARRARHGGDPELDVPGASLLRELPRSPHGDRGSRAGPGGGWATCLSCHGVGYANILPGWQHGMERRLGQVSAIVQDAGASVGRVPAARRAAADSLLGLARENVDLVRRGKGAHNIEFADNLLGAAVELIREAVRRAGSSYRVPEAAWWAVSGTSAVVSPGDPRAGESIRGDDVRPRTPRGGGRADMFQLPHRLSDHARRRWAVGGMRVRHHQGAGRSVPTPRGARGARRDRRPSRGDFSHGPAGAGVGCVDCH